MKLAERPEPQGARLASLTGANYGDVVVQVHASGFTWDADTALFHAKGQGRNNQQFFKPDMKAGKRAV
jgi:hypothetical protein